MPEVLTSAIGIILTALATLLATWFSVLGSQLKAKYNEKVNTQIKKDVVDTTVAWVQQMYYALDGDEKLSRAMSRASELLTEKGIPVTDVELRTLIESAVYGLKKGFYETEELTNSVNALLETTCDGECNSCEDKKVTADEIEG